MKYVNLRVLELSVRSLNKSGGKYNLQAEEDDFSFDEDEQDDFLDEMINKQMEGLENLDEKSEMDYEDSEEKIQFVNMSDFHYTAKSLLVNAYRISTLEDTLINGVPVTLLNLGNKNVIVSLLSAQQLLNLIASPDNISNQELNPDEEKQILHKLNNPSKFSAEDTLDESILD